MFGIRIKNLREQKGLTQKSMSEETGINVNTLASYEKGTREPNFETLCKLASYFDCTTDYLLGMSEFRNIEEKEFVENQLFFVNEFLLSIDGKHRSKIIECIGFIINGCVFNAKDDDFINYYVQNIEMYCSYLQSVSLANVALGSLGLHEIENTSIFEPGAIISSATELLDLTINSSKLLIKSLTERHKSLVGDSGISREELFDLWGMLQHRHGMQAVFHDMKKAGDTNAET